MNDVDFFMRFLYNFFKNQKVIGLEASKDYIASCLMKAAKILRLNVPEDLSIVGFDNHDYFSVLDGPFRWRPLQYNNLCIA